MYRWDPVKCHDSKRNGNPGVTTLSRAPKLEPHQQMEFSVIPRIPSFGRGFYSYAENTDGVF